MTYEQQIVMVVLNKLFCYECMVGIGWDPLG